MDPCGLPSRALSWSSAKGTCALPGRLCRHGHPPDGKEPLGPGLPGRTRGPCSSRGLGSTSHHPETLRGSSASSAEPGTRAASVTFR